MEYLFRFLDFLCVSAILCHFLFGVLFSFTLDESQGIEECEKTVGIEQACIVFSPLSQRDVFYDLSEPFLTEQCWKSHCSNRTVQATDSQKSCLGDVAISRSGSGCHSTMLIPNNFCLQKNNTMEGSEQTPCCIYFFLFLFSFFASSHVECDMSSQASHAHGQEIKTASTVPDACVSSA
uniref:Uncharacterized protein n=1 Tax=Arundo donax TaxID=35708 RepID=A0A0A9DGD6_ARUDO